MSTEIKVPVLPESVADASIATWHKQPGDACERDENLVDIETDKVVLEVVAPEDGVLEEIIKQEGDTVTAEEVIAKFKGGATASSTKKDTSSSSDDKAKDEKSQDNEKQTSSDKSSDDVLSPAVRRLVNEHNLDVSSISANPVAPEIRKEALRKHTISGPPSPQLPIRISPLPNYLGWRWLILTLDTLSG